MATTIPDLRTSPPRSGKETLGRYVWLARLADKARAQLAGTNAEYVAYCPVSQGFLERAGIGVDDFGRLIEQDASDEQLIAYFDRHVSTEQRERANRFVLDEHRDDLAQQDAEEGR
jgi:hypothetical protein